MNCHRLQGFLSDFVEVKGTVFQHVPLHIQVTDGEGEDGQSIQHHVTAMKSEWSKSVKDYNLIDDRMKRTIVDRRTMIQTSRIEEVLDKYPCLACDVQVRDTVYC